MHIGHIEKLQNHLNILCVKTYVSYVPPMILCVKT